MASYGGGEGGPGAAALLDLYRLVSDVLQGSGDAELAAAAASLRQPHSGGGGGPAHATAATPAGGLSPSDGLALFARAAAQHGSLRARLSEPECLDLFAPIFRDAACEVQWAQVRRRGGAGLTRRA